MSLKPAIAAALTVASVVGAVDASDVVVAFSSYLNANAR